MQHKNKTKDESFGSSLMNAATEQENIYTVSRLNTEARFILENAFAHVWVEGEVSNFAAPNSGHWYFSLKDASAQIRCAMFKGHQRKLTFLPKDGMHVLVKARASLYENRGEFQLIVEDMEERGEGKLRRAFELLKKKLETNGLFDPAHKKPLPLFPQKIGVITSSTGAAIRDILTVLKRRYACVPVVIYPTLVQGETAAPAIVQAIQRANRRKECDVLILARGGGSLEDLWPFNEEIVANAIFQSELPIISGVGHEVDFTIADFVADKRAPTPSAAAEMITPDKADLLQLLSRHSQHVLKCIRSTMLNARERLGWMHKHLGQQHPKRKITEKMQRLDYFELTLVQLQTRCLNKLDTKLKDLNNRLSKQLPSHHIRELENELHLTQERLNNFLTKHLNYYHLQLANYSAKLDTLSPLATLSRGYAIATNSQHQILRDVKEVKDGEDITVQLAKGELLCQIKQRSS